MPRYEASTDLWVAKLLNDSGIPYEPKGSLNPEIKRALKGASKQGTGHIGFPEYIALSKDFILVIEDKADRAKHSKFDSDGVLDLSASAIKKYAVNGALHYALHITQNTKYKKVFAIGVSGDERSHDITPLYVDDRGSWKQLPEVETFACFSSKQINNYYCQLVLNEPTDTEKTTEQILKDAEELNAALRSYGSVREQDRALVVSGILLALDEVETGNFSIDSLTGNSVKTDGQKIFEAISSRLTRSSVGPEAKKDKVLSEFSVITTSVQLNALHSNLGETPLRFFTQFLYDKVFMPIKMHISTEDFIGRFYGEFMRYSGGDGQGLGIILTPRHITDLMCDLVQVKASDIVFDGCCGTGGFLISAMQRMLEEVGKNEVSRRDIKKRHLHGIDNQANMFAIAVTNMILRDDGNANIQCEDFLAKNAAELVRQNAATVGLLNPPYSQAQKTGDPNQYELCFVKHELDSLVIGGRCAVIVPVSSMTGKTNREKEIKKDILKDHTLEGVITCNEETFYGVGTHPCIAVFTAHEPHPSDKLCKFISFKNDGYEGRPHVGLIATPAAEDRKNYLLDVWNDTIDATNDFCVKSSVTASDEWIHSYFYFNDTPPCEKDFEKTVADYLTFQFSMIAEGRSYLFENEVQDDR